MQLKTKLILGAGALSALALAFSAYKTYKELKVVEEENRIEEEQIKAELDEQERKAAEEDALKNYKKSPEEIADNIMSHYNYIGKTKTVEDLEDELSEIGEMGVWIPAEEDYYESEGEVSELRFPPNSLEAMNQYKAYRLSDLRMLSKEMNTLYAMFEDPFTAPYPEDELILDHIMEARIEFFGEDSVYIHQASMAEVYLHFAGMLSVDLDRPFDRVVSEMLKATLMLPLPGSLERINIFQALNDHQFANGDLVGLFGTSIHEGGVLGVSYMKEYYNKCDAELEKMSEEDIYADMEEAVANWDEGEEDEY